MCEAPAPGVHGGEKLPAGPEVNCQVVFQACPACGSRRLRPSLPRGRSERFWNTFGLIPVRCADCSARYAESLWQFGDWRYACCPKCFRTDLGTWSERHYMVRWDVRLLLSLGAKKFRCEVCRCNFASFRRLKTRFSFHRNSKQSKAELSPD
jgi:endogenous inhibitor of DNA gyrase (YacG/DUF329 family)